MKRNEIDGSEDIDTRGQKSDRGSRQGRGRSGEQGRPKRKGDTMSLREGTFAALLLAAVVCLADDASAGSCSAAKLCCQGRDSGCVIQKESPNAIIESPRDKPCYCDHACLKLGDCCDDFKETCGVVDCAVDEWGDWSSCDNGCGSGTQRRTRQVKNHDRNGGKHCPRLDQVRSCRSFVDCLYGNRQSNRGRSTTLLSLTPNTGNYSDDSEKDNYVQESSCIAFTVVRASRACGRISASLTEGSRICVQRDDDEATVGSVGIGRWKLPNYRTADGRVTSTNSSCHGKWIGDPRMEIDCSHFRCKFLAITGSEGWTVRRIRRGVGDEFAARTKRRRRWKRRRRQARGILAS